MSGDLRRTAVAQQVFLNRCHAQFPRRDLRGKSIGLAGKVQCTQGAVAIEPEKQPAPLVGCRMTQLNLSVDTARTDERGVESFGVIRGEEEHPPFARAYAVECVQQPAQGDARVAIGAAAFLENAVDVFDQQQRPDRQVVDQAAERFIGHEPVGQGKDGHRQLELAGHRKDQGRLARPRRPMKQVTSPVGNPTVGIP